jgi:hypothetical protein
MPGANLAPGKLMGKSDRGYFASSISYVGGRWFIARIAFGVQPKVNTMMATWNIRPSLKHQAHR